MKLFLSRLLTSIIYIGATILGGSVIVMIPIILTMFSENHPGFEEMLNIGLAIFIGIVFLIGLLIFIYWLFIDPFLKKNKDS